MNRELLKAKIAEAISSTNKSGNEKLEAILAAVDAYSSDGYGAKPLVSGSLPPAYANRVQQVVNRAMLETELSNEAEM